MTIGLAPTDPPALVEAAVQENRVPRMSPETTDEEGDTSLREARSDDLVLPNRPVRVVRLTASMTT